MTWYVYGLFDACIPRRIRYVGCTSDLRDRMMSHRCMCKSLTRQWLWTIRKSGSELSVKVLERCTSRVAGLKAERKWILKLPGLLNKRNSRKSISGKHL